MHATLLDIAGAILLASSLVTAILLLRHGVKSFAASPLALLIISDVLGTALVAVLVILCGSAAGKPGDKLGKVDMVDGNVDCGIRELLTHHAAFLVPLTDAFTSLLAKWVQCDGSVKCLESKLCGSDVQAMAIETRGRQLASAGLKVAGQWIIPVALLAMFVGFGPQQLDVVQRTQEMPCVFMSTFPMDDCLNLVEEVSPPMAESFFNKTDLPDTGTKLVTVDSVTNSTAETDEIILRLREIVGSFLSVSTPRTWSELPQKSTRSFKSTPQEGTHSCATDGCVISRDFLRIQFSFLLFFVYFGSILLSSVLCTRIGHVQCRLMDRVDGPTGKSASTEALREAEGSWVVESSESRPASGGSAQFGGLQLPNVLQKEVSHLEKIRSTLKRSFYFAVAMWTPMLLQMFIKIFFCSGRSEWLTNSLYLLAISFGLVRNVLNLGVINIKGVTPQPVIDKSHSRASEA